MRGGDRGRQSVRAGSKHTGTATPKKNSKTERLVCFPPDNQSEQKNFFFLVETYQATPLPLDPRDPLTDTHTLRDTRPMSSSSSSGGYRLDVDAYVDYYWKVYLCQTACGGAPNLLCLPCVIPNLRDFAEAVHVRVTSSDVVYTRERIATCWRLSCCDQGRLVKSVPLEKVTDVVLLEPAGGCPPQTLYTVQIQTASNSGAMGAELTVTGLPEKDARALRGAILARRRGGAVMRRT